MTLGNIEKLIIQKKDKYFTELGSKFSFFTSLNDDESIGISISIGVSKPGFQNNIVIELNADYKEKKVEEFDEIAEVFKKLIVICLVHIMIKKLICQRRFLILIILGKRLQIDYPFTK